MKCFNDLRITGHSVLGVVFCRCDKYVINATCHSLHGGLAQGWAEHEERQLMVSGGQSSRDKVERQDGTLTAAKHEEKVLFSFMMKDNFSKLGASMFAVSQVENSTHSCTFQAVGLQLYLAQLCLREARKSTLCFCANTHYPGRDSAGRASICPQVATCALFPTKSPSATQEQCQQAHPSSLDSGKNSCHTN